MSEVDEPLHVLTFIVLGTREGGTIRRMGILPGLASRQELGCAQNWNRGREGNPIWW